MQTPEKDRLDLWLDHALRQQGDVEPRLGLESRVLASLNARERNQTRAVWVWALSGVVVATLLLVVFLRPSVEHTRGGQEYNSVAANASRPSLGELAPKGPASITVRASAPKQRPADRHRVTSLAPSGPRLSQFPSPRPLEPQEVALARYAESYPKEADLIAKEQEDFDLEIQQAQKEVEAGSTP